MKKIIYQKQKVELGQKILLGSIKVTLTQEIIDDNPDMFEVVKAETPKYWMSDGSGTIPEGNVYAVKEWTSHSYFISTTPGIKPFKHIGRVVSEEDFREALKKTAEQIYSTGDKIVQGPAYGGSGGVYLLRGSHVIVSKVRTRTFSYINVSVDGKGVYCSQNGVWAERLKPLFTTEDGVDVYEGDEFWWVDITANRYHLSSKCICRAGTFHKGYPKSSLVFSTKEAAEKWVAENKPKDLKYYENQLNLGGNTVWCTFKFKLNEPKLYWTKVLQLIADDLNDREPSIGEEKFFIYFNGDFWAIGKHQTVKYSMTYFKSGEDVRRAVELMEDNLKHLK